MRKLHRDIELVDAQAERIQLEIDSQARVLTVIELEKKELELDLQAREADNVWIKEAVLNSREVVKTARIRLAEAENVLAIAVGVEKSGTGSTGGVQNGNDPVAEVLRQTATREQAGRVGDLLLTVNQLTMFVTAQAVHADSLESRVVANELEIGRIRLLQDVQIAKKRADVDQKIRDLNISLEKDLPHTRDVLKSELETERVKVELISPLERVGTISVSDKAVRPRKARAAAILTILAFFGSLFLVLVWEYIRNNRVAITAARHDND